MNGISAVLFDFGLVLSEPPRPSSWSAMLELLGANDTAFHDAYWKYRDDYDKGTLSGTEYWQQIARDLSISVDETSIKSLKEHDVELWTDMNEPMVEWVHRLQKTGLRTGVLSNIGDAMAEGICAKFIWIGGFTHCVWSHALKMRKPEPEIYVEAAKGLGVPAGEILFIDDRPENVEAAEKAGMRGIVYAKHFPTFEQDMKAAGYGQLLGVANRQD
ncbi:MAG: HAD family phosphatase [Acidobacteria bacterium]|nr:HAD family phosphatase [Acidobacteriota bacterium]